MLISFKAQIYRYTDLRFGKKCIEAFKSYTFLWRNIEIYSMFYRFYKLCWFKYLKYFLQHIPHSPHNDCFVWLRKGARAARGMVLSSLFLNIPVALTDFCHIALDCPYAIEIIFIKVMRTHNWIFTKLGTIIIYFHQHRVFKSNFSINKLI